MVGYIPNMYLTSLQTVTLPTYNLDCHLSSAPSRDCHSQKFDKRPVHESTITGNDKPKLLAPLWYVKLCLLHLLCYLFGGLLQPLYRLVIVIGLTIACIICCWVNVTLDIMILGVEDILISWFVIILALLGVASLFVCCMIHCKHLRLSDANKLSYLLTYLLTYLLVFSCLCFYCVLFTLRNNKQTNRPTVTHRRTSLPF